MSITASQVMHEERIYRFNPYDGVTARCEVAQPSQAKPSTPADTYCDDLSPTLLPPYVPRVALPTNESCTSVAARAEVPNYTNCGYQTAEDCFEVPPEASYCADELLLSQPSVQYNSLDPTVDLLEAPATPPPANYVAYDDSFVEKVCIFRKSQLVRVFVGQLPHWADVRLVAFAVFNATGCHVFHVERTRGTNYAHVFCLPSDKLAVCAARAVLFDYGGLWVAKDASCNWELSSYVSRQRKQRHISEGFPCACMNIEVSRSERNHGFQ